ncbi:MAG: FAD-binding protein, partial [Solirubrobacterales bacterium]|nr:FAD-binding protein [Solirubrobacterales bacterium]
MRGGSGSARVNRRYRQAAMARIHDLVVLGGGTAGLIAARTAAGLGARVALIEAERPGGDCLCVGCVPSKALLATAGLAQRMRSADQLGLEPVEPAVDFSAVMDRVRAVIRAAGEPDLPERLAAQGIELIGARGEFVGPAAIAAGGRTLRFRAALIATGSRPVLPPVPGLADARPLTNETVWELSELPRRLAVIGAGSTGVELGQAFARLGSEVAIVERLPRPLADEDHEASALLAEVLRAERVELRLGAAVERVEAGGDGPGALALGHARVEFDRVLVAAGRRAETEGLGLERAGVDVRADGAVRVDRFLRTSAPHVYAAGDVVGGLRFTHVAAYHALIVVANALFRARRRAEREWIPRVTFTEPEIARVGLGEAEARERLGGEPLVFRHDHAELDRALTAGARGFSKLVCDRRGRLLGATIVGPAAGESIAEVARLVREGRRVADLSQMVHAYPTFTESPARAADEWWRRRYFTPRARRLLRPLLCLSREETAAYCAARGETPLEDESNASPAFLRNRVRGEILPILEELRPGSVDRIGRFARLAADDDALLEEVAEAELARRRTSDGG